MLQAGSLVLEFLRFPGNIVGALYHKLQHTV